MNDTPPAADPAPDDAPLSFRGWLAQNAASLVLVAAAVAVVLVKYNPVAVLLAVLGLGLVIFVHELGHFAAAKWCDVHVETFSIGFGPALPGCRFRYGETTYMLALVPLGGYVKMVGEGADGEDGEDDPRSFKNKTVGQRMLIISAGVVMNLILAAVCFVAAYSHGVEEHPGVVGGTSAGSPAWVEGVRSGSVIERIGSTEKPWFNDVRPAVMHTSAGETVPLVTSRPGTAGASEFTLEPAVDKEASFFPYIGISPPQSLVLAKTKDVPPVRPQSAAARATPAFEGGDAVVACSDPDAAGNAVTPLPADPRNPAGDTRDAFEFWRRMERLAGRPVVLRVKRAGGGSKAPQEVDVEVPPEYHRVFGLRMRAGQVVAVRKNSPAAKAEPVGADAGRGLRAARLDGEQLVDGDVLKAVEVAEPDGKTTRWVTALGDAPADGWRVLDPVRLPFELSEWASRQTKDRPVTLTVLRPVGHEGRKEITFKTEYDDSWRFDRETLASQNAPVALNGLGLAYRVETVVDDVRKKSPAEDAGFRAGDVVKEVRFRFNNEKKELVPSPWTKLRKDQWAYFFAWFQANAQSNEVDFKVERDNQTVELTATAGADPDWPDPDRGWLFAEEKQLQKADGFADALAMGARKTVATVGLIYGNLRAMVFGRVSPFSLSGPLTIANVSYRFASADLFYFVLFLGMINVNLAVINFLPIPVLDGGHMVFLVYEAVRGKPASEQARVWATFVGLAMILSLMGFVIVLDVSRLFF